MKKIRRYISAANSSDDSKLMLAIDALKDDFDYIIAGLEKLDRSGAESSNQGLIIAERLQDQFQAVIAEIGDNVG